MKNSYLFLFLICLTHTAVKAQELSYGVLLGANAKDIEIEGDGLSAGAAYSVFNYPGFPLDIGVYVDYALDASFGIKTNLYYGKTVQEYYTDINFRNIPLLVEQITLQPMLKYDVNKEYGKGFYLLAGPRASFVISSKFADSDVGDADGFLKGSNFGAGIGFGFSFSKTIGFEMMGDYGLSNLLNSSDMKTKTAGASVNLYVNLEEILNK